MIVSGGTVVIPLAFKAVVVLASAVTTLVKRLLRSVPVAGPSRIHAADDNFPLWRAALSQHLYVGVVVPCRWQCAALHGLQLVTHEGILLALVLGGSLYLTDASGSGQTGTPLVSQVMVICLSLVIVVPIDVVISAVMRHYRREELPLPASLQSEIPQDDFGTSAKDHRDAATTDAAVPSAQAVEVRWDDIGDDLRSIAITFGTGGALDAGGDEDDAVGRLVVLDDFMIDATAVVDEHWVEQDEIEIEDDAGTSQAGESHHVETPDKNNGSSSAATRQPPQPMSKEVAQLFERVRVVQVVAPWRFFGIVLQLLLVAGSFVVLFILTLSLESKNRTDCSPDPATSAMPLHVVALITDFGVQWIVVLCRHLYDIFRRDDFDDDDEDDTANSAGELSLVADAQTMRRPPSSFCSGSTWLKTFTKHNLELHPFVGEQALVVPSQ